MTRPIASNIGVSFAYGARYKNGVIHKGVDFSDGHEGHDVFSCLDGIVMHSGFGGWGPAYGQHIIVKSTFNGKTKWVLYGHLKTAQVSFGRRVYAGQKIGTSGGSKGTTYSGNSTGPHLHVQVGHADNYLAYEDPWAVIHAGSQVQPVPIDPWFTGLSWNLSASDAAHGQASWDKRVPALIDAIKHYDRDVLHLVEAETQGAQGARFAKALKGAGYVPVVGDNQRLLAVRKGIRVGRSKVVTLAERGPANDDKQIVLAEVWPDGPHAVALEAGHLEFRNGPAFDKVRVTQGRQTKTAGVDFARACGIELSRVVYSNDENSRSQVSTDAFGKTWVDLGDRDGYEHGTASTLIGWDGRVIADGYRPDKVHVHKDRPARGGTSTTLAGEKLADHLPVIYTVGKK